MKAIQTLRNIAIFTMLSLSTPALAADPVTVTLVPTPAAVVADEPIAATTITIKPEATVVTQPPVIISVDQTQLECLVKVMNHEAGGEGTQGQKAVAYVVINRTKSGRFPTSVCGVVYQRSQFTNIVHAKAIPTNKYNQLKELTLSVLSSYSHINDPTIGSLWYHNHSVWPGWRNMIHTINIGHHIFYASR